MSIRQNEIIWPERDETPHPPAEPAPSLREGKAEKPHKAAKRSEGSE